MADCFISYSRRDKEFVAALQAALTAHGREAWVDWEDIPPTADWLAEIHGAIEAADAFLFVISPDSIASKVCAEELAYAVSVRKRLVPLVRRDVPAAEVPPALAALNWIFCRDTDDFEAAVATLLTALDTDLAWTRTHTRLLTRALEWERRGQNPSFLLRGQDLREADEALALAGEEKQPQPAQLQREYVLASRRAAAREQRLRVGFLAGALAVTLILLAAVALLWQRTARLLDEALARQVAAQAQVMLERDDLLPRGALLAVEAMRRLASLESDQALRRTADLLPQPAGQFSQAATGASRYIQFALDVMDQPAIGVASLAYSPDGRTVATGATDNSLRLWDAATGAMRRQLGAGGTVNALAFGPDGTWVAAGWGSESLGTTSGGVTVWEVASGREIATIQTAAAVKTLTVSPDGRYLATTAWIRGVPLLADPSENAVRLISTDTWREERQLRHGAKLYAVAFSPDSRFLAAAGEEDATGALGGFLRLRTYARIWEVESGKQVQSLLDPDRNRPLATPISASAVAFSPDGRYLAVGSGHGARIWQAPTSALPPLPKEAVRLDYPPSVHAVAFTPDGKSLLTGADDHTLRRWNLDTGRETARAVHADPIVQMQLSSDGHYVVTVPGADSKPGHVARLWETATLREVARATHDSAVNALAFRPDGQQFATTGADRITRLWSVPESGREADRFPQAQAVTRLWPSPDGRRLATLDTDERVRLWDIPARRSEVAGLRLAAFSPDGQRLAAASGRDVTVLDPASRAEQFRLTLDDDVSALAFSPDGAWLAAESGPYSEHPVITVFSLATRQPTATIKDQWSTREIVFFPDGRQIATFTWTESSGSLVIHLWDTATGQEVRQWSSTVGKPDRIAVSPDGRWLAGDPTAFTIWEAATGREVRRIPDTYVTSFAFSPDSRLVAGASNTSPAHVWRTDSGDEVSRLTHESPVNALAFSPDSRAVALGGQDGSVRIWRAETGEEVARVRAGDRVFALAFSPDGRWLYTGGWDDAVERWLWRPDDMIEAACARLTRNLTRNEWDLYLPGQFYRATCPGLPVPP